MKVTCSHRFILFCVCALAWCSVAKAGRITVSLDNPPATGTVAFVLFDSANAFGDFRDPVKTSRRQLDGREVYRIENIPPSEYALMVYYDENNNDRIDRNFIGIPNEPLGFSNRYRAKGPPSYSRAAFVLTEGEPRHFDVELYRPLGKRGRLGVGLGILARSSPYRDHGGGVYQVIPAVAYNGGRLQIYGPNIQVGLIGSGKLRLAATGRYRMGAYEDDDNDYLSGMGDARETFMAGLALQAEAPGGVDVSVSYTHDALGRIGGGEARFEVDKSFQIGLLRLSPQIGVNWLGSELANNDFGVPSNKATSERPAYALDAAISVEGGMGMFVELGSDWLMIVNASVEILDKDVTRSPIVSEDHVIKGFGAISYIF